MSPQRTSPDGSPVLPRELVLASAGTGKTFTLTSRLVGLLALGVPPEDILASTFTRKAAGEILERTLFRLAEAGLNEAEAAHLGRHALLEHPGNGEEIGCAHFLALLGRLLRELHRLNVGTLDSFFGRVARTFPSELGLPPDWSIADDPTAKRLDSEALQELLERSDPGEAVELVRMIMRGESGRRIHDRLLDQLAGLREIYHLARPDAGDPWHPFPDLADASPVTPEAREAAADMLTSASIPVTSLGKPDRNYEKAVTQAASDLRAGNWNDFCKRGLGAKLLSGEDVFSGKGIPSDLRDAVRAALILARTSLGRELNRQTQALKRLAKLFDTTLTRLQAERSAYRFQDIAFLLGGDDPVGTRPDLWYRLDQRARHLLLDEFQDTALTQWEAVVPLAEEILDGNEGRGSAVIVADPKQSIYGWRGAEPDLVHRVGERFGLRRVALRESYRSSQVILDFVNRVFTDLPLNPVWKEEEERDVARAWQEDFLPHQAAHVLEGYVGLHVGPRDERMARTDRPELMAWAAGIIRDLVSASPGRSLGVLVRTNQAVARITLELRRLGVDASEEGATTLTDSAAVSTVMAALLWADHPGDTFSLYQVAHSPLGPILGLRNPDDPIEAPKLAARVRAQLLSHGYGPTLAKWIQRLGGAGVLSERDLRRLLQLMELGYRWDSRATLRPEEFVGFVHSERMEAPSDADVRVMTVHQAKGLEFDMVALPELDLPMTRGRGHYSGLLPLREPGTGRFQKIFPRVAKQIRSLFPEACRAEEQDRKSELRDALGLLYVAFTRPRHALHLFLAEDDGSPPATPRSDFSAFIRGSLGLEETLLRMGQTVWEHGNPGWSTGGALREGMGSPERPGKGATTGGIPEPAELPGLVSLRTAAGQWRRNRSLSHRTPSAWGGGEKVDLSLSLPLRPSVSRHAGALVHAWLQEMEWLEDWSPSRSELQAIAAREAPSLSTDRVEALIASLEGWLQHEEISSRLSRGFYPPGARVETEAPFAVRIDASILQGRMDRVVTVREDGRVAMVHVLDFKTDALSPRDEEGLDRLAAHYRGQMEAYREALLRIHRLTANRVRATLLFLAAGRAIDLETD